MRQKIKVVRLGVAHHAVKLAGALEVVLEAFGDGEDSLQVLEGEFLLVVRGKRMGCADGILDL